MVSQVQELGIPLVLGAVLAMIMANVAFDTYELYFTGASFVIEIENRVL